MKLTGLPLAVALLMCALPAPALAQQGQQQADDEAERASNASAANRTNFTGGRFTMDLAGQNVGAINRVDANDTVPAIQDQNASAAATTAVSPSLAVRPGAIVTAPVAADDDKDD